MPTYQQQPKIGGGFKKKQCKKGRSCGAACIDMDYVCRKNMANPEAMGVASNLSGLARQAIGGGGGGGAPTPITSGGGGGGGGGEPPEAKAAGAGGGDDEPKRKKLKDMDDAEVVENGLALAREQRDLTDEEKEIVKKAIEISEARLKQRAEEEEAAARPDEEEEDLGLDFFDDDDVSFEPTSGQRQQTPDDEGEFNPDDLFDFEDEDEYAAEQEIIVRGADARRRRDAGEEITDQDRRDINDADVIMESRRAQEAALAPEIESKIPKYEESKLRPIIAPGEGSKPLKEKWKEVPDSTGESPEINRQYRAEWDADDEVEEYGTSAQYAVGQNIVNAEFTGNKMYDDEVFETTNLDEVLAAAGKDRSYLTEVMGDIAFTVNGEYEAGELEPVEGISPEQAAKRVASAAKLASAEVMSTIPDGTIIENTAYTADGKGDSRQKAYLRQGFGVGEVTAYGDRLMAIKIDGKLYPITDKNIVKKGELEEDA